MIPSTGVWGLLALPNENSWPGILFTFCLITGTILASLTFLNAWFAYNEDVSLKMKRLRNLNWSKSWHTLASDAFSLRHILLSFIKSLGSSAFLLDLSWYIQCWVTVKIQTGHCVKESTKVKGTSHKIITEIPRQLLIHCSLLIGTYRLRQILDFRDLLLVFQRQSRLLGYCESMAWLCRHHPSRAGR